MSDKTTLFPNSYYEAYQTIGELLQDSISCQNEDKNKNSHLLGWFLDIISELDRS